MFKKITTTIFWVICSLIYIIILKNIILGDSIFIIKIILTLISLELFLIVPQFIIYLFGLLKINKWITPTNYSDLTYNMFSPKYKLPKDRDIFQKSENNNCMHSKLPMLNMNDYNFDNTFIAFVSFHKKTILPNDPNFFQKIRFKSLDGTTLPIGDYSKYNFEGISLRNAKFRDGSILPSDINLFQYSLIDRYSLRLRLPQNCADTIHYYNFNGVELNLIEKLKISSSQYYILSKQLNKESMDASFDLIKE